MDVTTRHYLKYIQPPFFSDDQIMVAKDREDLEYMTRNIQKHYQLRGMIINTSKTKYLHVGSPKSGLDYNLK